MKNIFKEGERDLNEFRHGISKAKHGEREIEREGLSGCAYDGGRGLGKVGRSWQRMYK